MYDEEIPELTPKEKAKLILRSDRRKWMKRLIAAAAVLAVFAVMLICVYASGARKAEAKYEQIIDELQQKLDDQVAVYDDVTQEVNIGVINTELRGIGELATMEYLYTDANRFSDAKTLFGANIPFTTKSCIVKWDGSIKAGIDVTKIKAEVDQTARIITVWLPAAEILSHEIDDESIEVLDEKDGLFNPIKLEDQVTLEKISKEAMEQRAIESGLLEKALENAKTAILKIMNANPTVAGNYSVEFKILE